MEAAIVKFALGYASSMVSEEALGLGVRRDLDFIADELKMMQGFLAAAEGDDSSKAEAIWLKQVRDVSREAEDYLKHLALQRGKNGRWGTLLNRLHAAKRVRKLRMKVEDVSQRRLRYHLTTGSKPTSSADAADAALPYVAYDEYVLHGDCEASHSYDGISLDQYKQTEQMVVQYNSSSVENGVLVLPGETDHSMVYRIASEQSKNITRTILKSLRKNELDSLCFTQFDESNVVVGSSGKVKFRNVSVVRNLIRNDLLQRQMDNYLSARRIIEDLFPGNPPEDIQHLLNLIEHEFGTRELYHVHGSLVSMATYPTFFKDMYEHIRFVLPKDDLRQILGSLPYVGTWKTLISTNELLQITVNYNPQSYEVPANKPNQTCLNKLQKKALQNLGLTPDPNQPSLTQTQLELIEALQFFDYLRNRTTHRMEPFKKWTQDNQAYSAQRSELVTYVRFPLIVPYMQLQLYIRNEHRQIPMDKLF